MSCMTLYTKPLRCFKYLHYDRSKAACHGFVNCALCTKDVHGNKNCENAGHCANDKSDHYLFKIISLMCY